MCCVASSSQRAHAGTSPSDLVDVPAHVLIVVARQGVPGKVVAQLMGHANVDTTLNVYSQVLDGSLRQAVEKVGSELFAIVHKRAAAPLRAKVKGQTSKARKQPHLTERQRAPLPFDL